MAARPKDSSKSLARVLVVEDDTPLALMVETLIRDLGYLPIVCVRGEDAVERARVLRPELVLMDVKLKGEMNGIEAASIIKAELGCPVVFMTAYSDPQYAARMREIAGANVLGKPLSEPILRLLLREKLGVPGRRPSRARKD